LARGLNIARPRLEMTNRPEMGVVTSRDPV